MNEKNDYKIVIVCTLNEIEIVKENYHFLNKFLNPKDIVIIGDQRVKSTIAANCMQISFIDENMVYQGLSLDSVRNAIVAREQDNTNALNRAGWYYQQFLKMAYAYICPEEDYLVWDADTIPTHTINMYNEEHKYFDVKTEYCKAYFRTINRLLPELCKENNYSYISEHMLINKTIMIELIERIEKREQIHGNRFWEKILNAIDDKDLVKSGFSEFETYGTYTEKYYPSLYTIRHWKSLREGTIFYRNGISHKELEKLAQKFDAVSFERHILHLKMQRILGHKIFQNIVIMTLYQKVTNGVKSVIEKGSFVKINKYCKNLRKEI